MDKEKWESLPDWIKEAWLDAAERCREADRRAAGGFAQSWAEWHENDAEDEEVEPPVLQTGD